MFTQCNLEIIINQLDNGFTIKWEKKPVVGDMIFGPRGFEIVRDKEELLARIGEIAK